MKIQNRKEKKGPNTLRMDRLLGALKYKRSKVDDALLYYRIIHGNYFLVAVRNKQKCI